MSKWNLERFTGGRRVIELEEGATKGATVGVNLFYNGVLVRWEDIYNGGAVTPTVPGTAITNWSLIADIPANIIALSGLTGTGIVVRTGDTTYALRELTSLDGSVTITDPDGVGGNIDLSASGGGGILPVVTGEVYMDQPRFVHTPDGQLIYARVE